MENRPLKGSFPVSAGILFGLGLGGFFDGIILHQVLQWHHMLTSAGYPVQPGIQFPEGTQSVTIGADGTVSVKVQGQAEDVQVGALTLADFVNPSGLQAIGGNLFVETGASGPAQQGAPGTNGIGQLAQGQLEGSNVNVV